MNRPLIILPTATVSKRNPNQPSNAGRLRIDSFLLLLDAHPEAAGAIIGGYPDRQGRTLAQKYYEYIARLSPENVGRIGIVSGKTNNTVDDLIGMASLADPLLNQPRAATPLYFVSYPAHGQRILPTLRRLGYTNCTIINSQERPMYAGFMDTLLAWITRLDPLWSGPLGWFLRAQANRVAARFRQG